MRVLFVADGRSEISRSWIQSMVEGGVVAELVSTAPTDPWPGLAAYSELPLALSGGSGARGSGARAPRLGVSGRTTLRQWVGPLTVPLAARRLHSIVAKSQPDLVHALRIPFEGMTAAWTRLPAPLVISTWGNDFTLHARSNPLMGALTRRAMSRVSGLHADCARDLVLARAYGAGAEVPAVVLPGNGGLPPQFLQEQDPGQAASPELGQLLAALGPDQPLVVNPRGLRAYVRTDTFFRAAALVLAQWPEARFACPAMVDRPEAMAWVERLELGPAVTLLGKLGPGDMARLLRRSQVMVSLSEHDGTPNSLLEAMACRVLPVAGRLDSIAEWIEHEHNGLLVDPGNPEEAAQAILFALKREDWRRQAVEVGRQKVLAKATRQVVKEQAHALYAQVVGRS